MTVSAQDLPRVLSIAGSDSGGGAGIQADLKAFARCGVHGMTAVTAVTAQNTLAVKAVWPLPRDAILSQVEAVADDMGVDAVKIGMLGTASTIAAVAEALELVPDAPVVLDPVMIAESGARLLDVEAHAALVELLVPRAVVVTPNVPEAEALVAAEVGTDSETLARAILELGPRSVVVTGGHRDEAVDFFLDANGSAEIGGGRAPDGAAHGSGCTHSSSLAAFLAHGLDPLEAAHRAKDIATSAVAAGLRGLGGGAGPVDALQVAERRERLMGGAEASRPGSPRRLT